MTGHLVVTSHVARDLLQSAALFRNEKLVIWEYVANSLQYVDPATTPNVVVTIDSRRKTIQIEDNGRGMRLSDLRNYFVMHGENVDRRAGRLGRGRFGTGKSAAFGIANILRVTSVKAGVRNQVELTRADIEKAGGRDIPVRILEQDINTTEPNGTLIEIEDVHLQRLDPNAVIRYIERHLAHWRGRPKVLVNSHECEFSEPPTSDVRTVLPDPVLASIVGEVQLTIKVACAPLDAEQQGISIYSNGNWLETTLVGLQHQPMANHIFGEIDVPILDDDTAPIQAFDMSRSQQLNPANAVVNALYGFLGREIDVVRRDLVRREQARRAEAETKRLQKEADRIADLINEDFADYSTRLTMRNALSGRGRDRARSGSNGLGQPVLVATADGIPGAKIAGQSHENERARGDKPWAQGRSLLEPDKDGVHHGAPAERTRSTSRSRGGFSVRFDSLGASEKRAKYVGDERAIYVNLDHPQIMAALGSGTVDDATFRRLAYEVAFSEYAVALASELAQNGEFIEPSEPIFEIRDAMNRMAIKAAALYAGN
jgi:hypothetical protein